MTQPAKHTPGPWTVSAGRTIETPSGQFYLTYNMDKHGNPLFRSFVELDSNAALIAAAPAMYEALHEMEDQLDQFTVKAQEELGLRGALEKIRAALAQAEGRPRTGYLTGP